MKKRQFGYRTIPLYTDLNKIDDYSEDNLQLFTQDSGYSETYLAGGSVVPDSPVSMSVFLQAITKARGTYGNRIYVSANQEIDMTPSGDPGVGNEVYMSAVIEYTYSASELDTDYNGASYYKNYDDSFTISVVEGTPAGTGLATKPAIPAGKLSICDILVTHAMYLAGQIIAGDINTSRQVHITVNNSSSTSSTDNELCRMDGTTGLMFQGTPTTPPTLSDVGILTIHKQLISDLAIGTAPLAITSTTKVSNLNVDQVDGCDVEDSDTLGTSDIKLPTQGNVKAYVDKERVLEVTNDNYTILDADGYNVIIFKGLTADKVCNLPTLAANQGRRLRIINETGTYKVAVTPEGAEKINSYNASFDINQQWGWLDVIGATAQWDGETDGNSSVLEVSSESADGLTLDNTWDDVAGMALTITPGKWKVSARGNQNVADTSAISYLEIYFGLGTLSGNNAPNIPGFLKGMNYLQMAADNTLIALWVNQEIIDELYSVAANTVVYMKAKAKSDELNLTTHTMKGETNNPMYIRVRRIA
jgi:hypothetical protein